MTKEELILLSRENPRLCRGTRIAWQFREYASPPKTLGFDFNRLRTGPFEGPAIVKPPALPGDTYFVSE